MAVLKAIAVWLLWTAAHAVAGLLFFAFVVEFPPFTTGWSLLIDGVGAGVLFGSGQWLVLRRFLPAVHWWLPATVVLSPISWYASMLIAFGTLNLGGWLGGFWSAVVQTALLVVAHQRTKYAAGLGVAYLMAAMLGSLIFYYGFEFAMEGNFIRDVVPLLVGSVGFGAITGVVIALFVWFTSRPSALPLSTSSAGHATPAR